MNKSVANSLLILLKHTLLTQMGVINNKVNQYDLKLSNLLKNYLTSNTGD